MVAIVIMVVNIIIFKIVIPVIMLWLCCKCNFPRVEPVCSVVHCAQAHGAWLLCAWVRLGKETWAGHVLSNSCLLCYLALGSAGAKSSELDSTSPVESLFWSPFPGPNSLFSGLYLFTEINFTCNIMLVSGV